MAYDGSIRINTKIDGKGFNSGIKGMMASLGSLAAAIGVVFGVQQMIQFGKTGVKTAMEMEAGWQGLRYMANAYGKDLNHIKEFLNDFTEDGLVPMMNAQQAYKNMLARGYSTDQLEKMLLIMKDSSVYLRKGQLDIGEAIEKTTMGLRTERSILTDSAGIEKNMYKMWQAYAKEMGTTISALTHEQKLIAEFQGFMKEGGIYAGAAAEYTETYAGKVAQLTAAMVSLKVSVGNMLIPLLNAILPKVIAMVKWFTYWFNIIGRVLNLLFGTQVGASAMDSVADDAYDAADAQDELGDATERAGKAAKGALASFDKLNVLAQPAPTSGAGSGEVGLPVEEEQGLFPEMEDSLDALDEKLAAFKEKLLAFFEPLREPFARLKEAFLTLGQTIWAGLGWAWENILFPFITWIVQSVSPLALDIITGALNVLNEILIAISPLFTWLWEEILQPLGQWAGEIFIQALTWIVEKLTEVSDWISTHQETVQNIAIILGSFAAAWILVNGAIAIWNVIGVIATAVTTAFGAAVAFLTSPIGLVILAIGAVIAIVILLIKYWDEVKAWAISAWEKIKEVWGNVATWFDEEVIQPVIEFFTGLWEGIKEIWSKAATWFDENVIQPIVNFFTPIFNIIYIIFYDLWLLIQYVWDKVATWFYEKVIQPIVAFFKVLWDTVSSYFTNLWEGIKAVWGIAWGWYKENVIDPIIELFSAVWTTVSEFFVNLWDDIKAVWEVVSDWFQEKVIDPVVNAWNTAITSIKDFFSNLWDDIVDGAKTGVNLVIDIINSWIAGIIGGINWLIEKWNNIPIPGWMEIPLISVPQIPRLATGAVIPANAPFAAILGDQKSGTNIEAPLKTIEQAVDNVLARRGMNTGADSGLIHNVIKLDGQVLYEAVKKIDRRVGTSLIAGSGIR